MADSVNFVPENLKGVTAYLVIKGAVEAIEYYKKVFNAEETLRLAAPDGSIGHAELKIAGGPLMLAEEVPDMDIRSPKTIGESGTGLQLYVDDPDAVFELAIENGATKFKSMADQFYGERSGTFDDPFGHRWTVSKRIENITNEEIRQRFEELYGED